MAANTPFLYLKHMVCHSMFVMFDTPVTVTNTVHLVAVFLRTYLPLDQSLGGVTFNEQLSMLLL